MTKTELIKYLNDNTKGRKAGRKEFKINDIFISSSQDNKNFRLTRFGKDVLVKHFSEYEIKLATELKQETGNQIMNLDRYMVSPYYLSRGKLVIFEESLAAEFVLIGNDFDLWVENKKFSSKT